VITIDKDKAKDRLLENISTLRAFQKNRFKFEITTYIVILLFLSWDHFV